MQMLQSMMQQQQPSMLGQTQGQGGLAGFGAQPTTGVSKFVIPMAFEAGNQICYVKAEIDGATIKSPQDMYNLLEGLFNAGWPIQMSYKKQSGGFGGGNNGGGGYGGNRGGYGGGYQRR